MIEITQLDLDLWRYKKGKEHWSFRQIAEYVGSSSRVVKNWMDGSNTRMNKQKHDSMNDWVDNGVK